LSTLRADSDPTAVLRGALRTVRVVHHASVTDKRRVGQLMRDIYAFEGHMVPQCALKLSALVWARPVEIRYWEWSEISEDGSEWRIPGRKMKNGPPARRAFVAPGAGGDRRISREVGPRKIPVSRSPWQGRRHQREHYQCGVAPPGLRHHRDDCLRLSIDGVDHSQRGRVQRSLGRAAAVPLRRGWF